MKPKYITLVVALLIAFNSFGQTNPANPPQTKPRVYTLAADISYWQQVYLTLDSCRTKILFADGIDGATRKSLTDKLSNFMNQMDNTIVQQGKYMDSIETIKPIIPPAKK